MTYWTDLLTTPHELRYIDAGGISTRSLVAGEGEPVVFLHGISGHLEAFIPVLAAHAEHFRVHLIDMLGHGYTDKPDVEYTVERLAQHVLDYLDATGIEKAHLVGISQGGQTAAYLAAERPERVGRVTLVVPAGRPNLDFTKVKKFFEITRDAVNADDPAVTRQRLEKVHADPASVTDELVEVRHAVYHQPEFRKAIDNILAASLPHNYEKDALTPERLAKIETEVLVVWGAHDPSGATGGNYLFPHLKHGRLLLFQNAGHWVPSERPDDFSKIDVQFLLGGLADTPLTFE